jgi:Xaa-Pro aminopeptidase
MTRKSRRQFLASTATLPAVMGVACTPAVQAPPERRRPVGIVNASGVVKDDVFAGVADTDGALRSVPRERYGLPFDDQEYAGRLSRVREAMAKANIDLMWVTSPEGMCYLHGYESSWYRSNSSTKWMPAMGTTVHVDHDKVILWDAENEIPSHAKDRRPVSRGGVRTDAPKSLATALQQEGWLKPGTRLGMEFGSYLPNRNVSHRFEAGFAAAGAKVVDGTPLMLGVRLVKSPAEIAAHEQAAKFAAIGHRAIVENFRPDITELELYGAVKQAMYSNGSEVPGLDMAIIPPHGLSHFLPTRRQIKAGEPFASDICGVFKRYHTNIARTYFWGDPPAEMIRLAKASEGAFEVLTHSAKAGTPVSATAAALRRFYQEQGVWDNRWYVGGYELGIAMQPDWVGEFNWSVGEEGDERVFLENMITNYESDLQSLVGRTPGATANSILLNIHTLVNEKNGARLLTGIPAGLFILG